MSEHSESVNGAKAGKNDAQEPSSSKDLSLVIANEPEEKPPEQSGEPSLLVLDKESSRESQISDTIRSIAKLTCLSQTTSVEVVFGFLEIFF
ncbi:hypothetical protein YC2023_117720 [Brassica napus]